jgi:hypothetical protein
MALTQDKNGNWVRTDEGLFSTGTPRPVHCCQTIDEIPSNFTGLAFIQSTNTFNSYVKGAGAVSGGTVAADSTSTITNTFRFSTTTTAADPGAGFFRFNNALYANVTFIYVDNLTYVATIAGQQVATPTDCTNFFKKLVAGDTIYVQDKNDANKYGRYKITTNVDNTGWHTFGVTNTTWGAGAALFTNNEDCDMTIKFTA